MGMAKPEKDDKRKSTIKDERTKEREETITRRRKDTHKIG